MVARDSVFRQNMMIDLDAKNGKTLWKTKGTTTTTTCLAPMGTENSVL